MDPGLRRRVRRRPSRHPLPADGGDIDNGATFSLLDQQLTKDVAHVERAVQVDVDDVQPHVRGHVDHRYPIGPPGRPRVVDDNVDPPELGHHPVPSSSTSPRSATLLTTVRLRRPRARTSSATESMSRQPAAFSSSG